MSHFKTITFSKNKRTYELEFDCEDPKNKVLETVTLIDGPKPEHDVDPTDFEDDLEDEDWIRIEEALELAK